MPAFEKTFLSHSTHRRFSSSISRLVHLTDTFTNFEKKKILFMLTKNLFIYLITAILPLVSALPPCNLHDAPLLARGFKHSPRPLHYPTPSSSHDGSKSTPTPAKNDSVIAAWYPGWLASTYPPEKLSWSKYNIMTFSFGYVTSHFFFSHADSPFKACRRPTPPF